MDADNDDIGTIGQNALSSWCSEVNATANPSTRDRKGWDFIVQFRPEDSAGSNAGPLDRLQPELSCLIQVKTSRSGRTSSRIKLSNLQRMVSDPMPWFVLFVTLDASRKPVGAWLVHIGQSYCSMILKRLRELGDTPLQDLHRDEHKLKISANDADRLPELDGSSLVARIRSDIVGGQQAYVQRKLQEYNTLGYDDSPREMSISLSGADPHDLWEGIAELGIGTRRTFPGYARTTIFDRRFGVLGTLKKLEPSDGEPEFVAPPVGRGTLGILSETKAVSVNLPCDVYRASAPFPFLPRRYDRVRIATPHLSLIVPFTDDETRKPPSFSVKLPDECLARRELELLLRCIDLLASDQPLRLLLEGSQDGHSWSGDLPLPALAFPDQLLQTVEQLRSALQVINDFRVGDNLEIHVGHLLEQRRMWEFLVNIDTSRGPLQGASKEHLQVGDTYGVPVEAVIALPSCVLYANVGIFGTITEVLEAPGGQNARRFVVAEPQVQVERHIVLREDADSFDQQAEQEKMDQMLRAKGCKLLHPRPRE